MPYEYLDHLADLGIRGIGSTPEEAFAEGARAMLAAMADIEQVRPELTFAQHCIAPDVASLFVEWLNELLYQCHVHGILFQSASVTHLEQSGQQWTLEGVASGEPLDAKRHELYTEVKAATYSGLDYHIEGARHMIQCVLDV